MVMRPDAIIVKDGTLPPVQDNIKAVVEIKFPPDSLSAEQRQGYTEIAGKDAELIELSPQICECPEKEKEKEKKPAPKPSPLEVTLLGLSLAALILAAGAGEEASDPLIPAVLGRLAMAF